LATSKREYIYSSSTRPRSYTTHQEYYGDTVIYGHIRATQQHHIAKSPTSVNMSSSNVRFSTYPGIGEWAASNLHYSQAAIIPPNLARIECSGQGGWDPSFTEYPKFPSAIDAEIAQAFENVDLALKHAGKELGKDMGWKQVYRVNSYHRLIDEEVTGCMVKGFSKWMGDKKPIWTQIGVKQLGAEDMRVEIEVVAIVD